MSVFNKHTHTHNIVFCIKTRVCFNVIILVLVWGHSSKSLRFGCFESDQEEIWHNCFSSKCTSTDGVRFLI